jgi:hypothetical protein
MKARYFAYITGLLMTTFFSCQNTSTERMDNSNVQFFDLKGYFENEIKNFDAKAIQKSTSINGQVQTKTLTEFDIAKEMDLFTKVNLTNPAWKDKFRVSQSPDIETYEALDDNLSLKQVIINKTGKEIAKISILTTTNNVLIAKEKRMVYQPKKGYFIENMQSVATVGKNDIKIEVAFLK